MVDKRDFSDLVARLHLATKRPHPWFGLEPGHTILISEALRRAEMPDQTAGQMPIEMRAFTDLCKCVRGDPRLVEFDGRFVAIQWAHVHCTYFGLIEWLIRRARAVGPDSTVSDLANYLSRDELTYEIFYVLGAVEVANIIQVNDRISLTPWTPPLRQSTSSAIAQPMVTHLGWLCPAALIRRDTVPRLHLADDAAPAHDRHFFDDMDDTLHCMTIAGPSGAYLAGVYFAFDQSLPLPSPSIGYIEPEVRGARRDPFPLESAGELRALLPLFQALPTNASESLLLPISRINLGMRRQHTLDTAIELGIALESFFLHDPSKKRTRGRITERLVARATGLLGHTAAERAAIADLFTRTYDIRSEAVHRASLKDLPDQAGVKPTLDTAYTYAAAALRLAVRCHNQFDWSAIEQSGLAEAQAAIEHHKARRALPRSHHAHN
jgi:hypothetical protein